MSAYDDECALDNPVRAWRGYDLTGDVITDISGNDGHGQIHEGAVLGIPGPIETDGTSFGVRERFGQADSPSGSDTDLRDNFTLEMWGLVDELVFDHGLLTRLGQWGLSGSFAVGFNSGSIYADISESDGTSHILSYGPILTATWYYIAVVRNGTTLSLQVNDQEFADIDSLFPAGPIVRAIYNSAPWVLNSLRSTHTGGFAFASDGGSQWRLYDTALTYIRRLAHYEAALNTLSLRGFSNVIPSAVLYSDAEPDPISFPFRHNWADNLIERISFRTGVSTARKGYEQANAQRIKPRREIEISQLCKDDYERRMLSAKLNAHQSRKWFIPMLEDRERLITPLSAGATTITTDTQYKNYEVGGYMGVRQLNDAGRITTWEEALIDALTNTQITISSPGLVNSYTTPEVYPVCRAIIPARQSLRGHADSVEDTTILARLVAEDERTTPRRIVTWTPGTTYKSHEVYPNTTWPNDWSELPQHEVERVIDEVDFEVGSFAVESDAIAASESFTWRILLQTKQQQAEFLGWFYARAGSLNYLWVPSVRRDFAVVSSSGDDLTVEGHNYSENYSGSEFRRDIAFIYNDHSMVLRRIESVSLSGVNEVLDLDGLVPSLTNLRSVSYLLFCRLADDTLEIARETDTKARFAWRFREVLSSPS